MIRRLTFVLFALLLSAPVAAQDGPCTLMFRNGLLTSTSGGCEMYQASEVNSFATAVEADATWVPGSITTTSGTLQLLRESVAPRVLVSRDAEGNYVWQGSPKPRIPDHVYATLKDACSSYPWPTLQSEAHLGELLNYVAWVHRGEGWGLSRKTGGKRVDSPVGEIAEDILQLPNGDHFDVLNGAGLGLRLQPSQAESIGIIDLRARPWVAPVAHTPSWMTGPTPTPAPIDPAPVTPPPTVDLTEVLVALSRIETRLTALENEKSTVDGALLSAYVDDMVGSGPAGDPALVPNHVTDLKQRLDVIRVQLEQLHAWLRSRGIFRF